MQDDDGVVPTTWWPHDDAGHTDEASKESVKLFGSDISFDTPKPERLLQRILHIATNPGDLVLDSFLGSGTTAAVAHKMGRRWIGVEMGEHARTHCATRLRKVIEGEQGGISKDVGWQGGGAFRFVTLGPRVYDENGVIAPEVRFADLARHVWFTETRRPLDGVPETPLLGIVNRPPRTDAPDDGSGAPLRAPDRAVALLFNGILRDRSAQGGNVLTRATLSLIREHLPQGFAGTLTVYATASRLSAATLKREGVQFRQTPYDLNAGGR
nr:site-specific DNA-methyltransferase [Paracoccus sp. S-4012]